MDPLGLDPIQVAADVDSYARAAALIVNAISQRDAPGFRLEAGKSIFQNDNGRVSISRETVRSNSAQQILGFPKPPSSQEHTKAEVHSHVVASQDRKTGANTSSGDVKRADVTGKPIYTAAPDGKGGVIQERYRPSDAQTVKDRQEQGGIIERFENNRWEGIGR